MLPEFQSSSLSARRWAAMPRLLYLSLSFSPTALWPPPQAYSPIDDRDKLLREMAACSSRRFLCHGTNLRLQTLIYISGLSRIHPTLESANTFDQPALHTQCVGQLSIRPKEAQIHFTNPSWRRLSSLFSAQGFYAILGAEGGFMVAGYGGIMRTNPGNPKLMHPFLQMLRLL